MNTCEHYWQNKISTYCTAVLILSKIIIITVMRRVIVSHSLFFLAFFWVAEYEHTVYITYKRVAV